MRTIFGGTYDPVHKGHIQMASELRDFLAIDKVYLMPCYQAVHKDGVSASPDQRLQMLRLALHGVKGIEVDEREIKRQSPSYTIESLCELREEIGVDKSLCLIVGADTAAGIKLWKNIEKFPELTNLAVINRPGVDPCLNEKIASLLESIGWRAASNKDEFKRSAAGKYLFVCLSDVPVSSTQIRNRVRKKVEVDSLVPGAVRQFIWDNNLYRSSENHKAR